MKALPLRLPRSFLPWLVLLVLATLVGYRQAVAQIAMALNATELVAGSYSGTVLVNEPVPLGDLELRIDITSANNQLAGQVNPARTQIFLGGPTFSGSVTVHQGITPTLRIESQTFSSIVSGRTVQRHFVLTGEVVNEGDMLRGEYTETIVGFKPQPIRVKGNFLLVRPPGVATILAVPTPRGATLTPIATPGPAVTTTPTVTRTATATPQPGTGGTTAKSVYLPVVMK